MIMRLRRHHLYNKRERGNFCHCVIVLIWKGCSFTQSLSLPKICDINCVESVVLKAFSNGDLCNLFTAQEGFPHSLTDGAEGRFTTRCQNGLVFVNNGTWWFSFVTFLHQCQGVYFTLYIVYNIRQWLLPKYFGWKTTKRLLPQYQSKYSICTLAATRQGNCCQSTNGRLAYKLLLA